MDSAVARRVEDNTQRRVSVQRKDIEGLRAVAVVLVVAGHLVGVPRGGFIGVDVFFVISGFLISGMLVKEFERRGRISFRDFYARRVRRILPAALVTLAVTCLTARVLFFDARARQTYVDALWASLSAANWHMAATGTDYFQSTLPPSAVQQYWSLSVEEQFYLVWPVLIICVGALASRWARIGVRGALKITFGLVIAFSLGWALFQSGSDTTVAYFSTLTRGWELAIGGLLAMFVTHLRNLPRWASSTLSWTGLVTVAIAAVITRSDGTFPAPGALPAVLGTAAVIAGGCSTRARYNAILMNPGAGFLGRISYSVYLWHWPVIIFSEALMTKGTLRQVAVVCAVTLLLSTLSFYFVEKPIRQTTWLSGTGPGRAPLGLSTRIKRGYTMVVACCAALALVQGTWPQEVAATETMQFATSSKPSKTAATSTPDSIPSEWTAQIQAATLATDWPDLTPSLDALTGARAAEWKACGNVGPDNESGCRFGDPGGGRLKTVVVIGDSEGISWIPAVRTAYEKKGWLIQGLTFGECPAPRIDVTSGSGNADFTKRCAEHQDFALQAARRMRPAVVILSSTEDTLVRIAGVSSDPKSGDYSAAVTAFAAAERNAVKQLRAKGTQVVILSSPPTRADLQSCATRVSSPDDCLTRIHREWQAMSEAEQSLAKATGATYIDTSAWTCSSDVACPSFIGTTPVMADGVHLTDAMSRRLGPLLYAAISR